MTTRIYKQWFTVLVSRSLIGLLLALAGGGSMALARDGETWPLKPVADIELPGPTGRFDYQSFDPQTHRLFIAHLAAGKMIVFDTESNKVIGEVPNVSAVHGVLVVPGTNRVYAAATGSNEVVAVDTQTLKEIARIPGGVYPDGMAYAPDVHKLYVSDERGRTETVIDTRTNQRVKTISLGGEAGNSQYDPVSKRVFVNVQTLDQLFEIDPQTDEVIARIPLRGGTGNHGLLIDQAQHLAYIACEGNAKLLAVDLASRKIVFSESVGEGPDVLAFDDGLHLLYVASESGVVSVFKQEGAETKKVGERLLAAHAHSVAVDSRTHRVYFPIENLNGRPVLRVMDAVTY